MSTLDAARRPRARAPRLAALLMVSLACGTAAWAGKGPAGPDLRAEGWRELPVRGKPGNRFTKLADGSIEVVSDASVSRIYRPVQVDLDETPILTWRWRVDDPVPPTDLTRKGEDDTALTLYVGFPWDPDRATFGERLMRPVVEAVAGGDAPGRVLAYVWGGDHERGETLQSPHLGAAGVVRVLRPADSPTGVWFEERVDVAADYRRAFGDDPPDPVQIAISADTDDTGDTARGFVADIAFVPADAATAADVR